MNAKEINGSVTPAVVDVPAVLRPFMADGRILMMPAKASRRRLILEIVVQDFDIGVRYSEKMVNLTLGMRHSDTAMLRRYLVDEDLMSRHNGVYWRTGGKVDV